MHPFTETQMKEFELQTLIFNYMASRIPIPSHLIVHFRRSFCFLDPYPLHPSLSTGRKVEEDPEPWRCKRTDGKKWRCSKEAFQDSKYCERHMHRGKKSSRKLVELLSSPNISSPQGSSLEFSSHPNCSIQLFLGSPAYMPLHQSYCRYCNDQVKEDAQECYNFFSEASSTEQTKEEEKKQRHCYVLGADLMLEKPQKPRPLLSLFNECADKSKKMNAWVDPEEAYYSKTQLSISIP